jgi:2-polyprenyl-3-methyl-5-hydroxy-6-metoxy-1,4-benzoquinol methylase
VSTLIEAVRAGFYARKQINSRSRLIAWSHRGRFATSVRLAREIAAVRVLDYGCGDGTFLGLLMNGEPAPRVAVGAELTMSIVADCRERFKAQKGLHFMLIEDLERPAHHGAYDAVYCMEVLEHVIDPAAMLDTFDRLLAPGGRLVISVPIETGLPVVVKQVVRRIAGWRGIGHYPGTTAYTPLELLRSIFARSTQHITRPIHTREDGSTFHDHKGFNWRVLRTLVSRRFDLVRESTSPVEWLGLQLGTQRWLIARKRAAAVEHGSPRTVERVA